MPAPVVDLLRRRRVVLYSHDTQGLGHVRRNLGLAAAVVRSCPRAEVLLVTGAPEAGRLPLPPRTEVVTLPTLRKNSAGRYEARVLRTDVEDVLQMRSRIIAAVVAGFEPDLLVVDKVARGVGGELDETLRVLHRLGTKVVLGLREILDEADVARAEWDAAGTTEAVRAHYDQIWVYGDPRVGDPLRASGLPDDLVRMSVHTGFLVPPAPATGAAAPDQPYVLCQVGGGQDGAALADAFVRTAVPAGHTGLLVTGPYMPAAQVARLRRLAAGTGVRVEGFVPGTERLVHGAAAVVSMAGYNSVCELLGARRPALLVPRVHPRREQLLRARRLERLGLVGVLTPDELTPHALGDWLAGAVTAGPPPRVDLDVGGLDTVPELVRRLLDPLAPAAPGHQGENRPDHVNPLEVARVAV